MVLGVIVGAIGTGLLITISINTTTLHWAAYLVVSGLGIGFGIQLPYSAVQVVLKYVSSYFQSFRLPRL